MYIEVIGKTSVYLKQTYCQTCQTFKLELCVKIVTDLKLFSQKPQILDIDILDIRVLNVKPGKPGMLSKQN